MYQRNGQQVLHVEAGRFTHIADARDAEAADFLVYCANKAPFAENYIADAVVTLSPSWHGDKVAKHHFLQRINSAIAAASALDQVKKTLFYGRDNNLIAEGQAPIGDGPLEHMGDFNADPRNIVHGVIGIFTEAGELLEMLREAYNGNGFDPINMREEIGDLFWYVAILFAEASRDGEGMTFEDAMRVNIAKLRKRFPDKFTERDANVRDLAAERLILEGGVGNTRTFEGGDYPAGLNEGNPARRAELGLNSLSEVGVVADDSNGGLRYSEDDGIDTSAVRVTTADLPLIAEAAPASGYSAVKAAEASAAKAFDAVKNVGNDPAPEPEPLADLGELAKPTSERLHPLPQENMAQNNAGTFDEKKV